jgi:uncharacterized protein (DUF58 family)
VGGARSTALLGLLLLGAAAVFDSEPLYVTGVAFVLVAAAAVVWVALGVRGLRVERTLGARRVVEDQPLRVVLTVTAGRLGRLLPSTIHDPLLEAPLAVGGGGRVARVEVAARFARRGRRALPAPVVVVRDPLGLAERCVRGAEAAELLVLPRVEPVTAAGTDGSESATVARRLRPGSLETAAAADLDGLGPWREGAPASRIHWPAVARTGEMLERRMRPEGDTRPMVVLDARGAEDDVDAAVRAAASLCVHLAERGGCSLLLPGDRRPAPLEPGLSGWPHLHARLAVVVAGGAPALGAMANRRGMVVYVSGRASARPPRALVNAPSDGRLLVVPGTLPGRAAAFAVAGCSGYDLGRPRAHRTRPGRETAA